MELTCQCHHALSPNAIRVRLVALCLTTVLLLALPQPSTAAEPKDALDAASAQRVTAGLQALYDFRSVEAEKVMDASGIGHPLNMTIRDPRSVKADLLGRSIRGKTPITSNESAGGLIAAMRESNALSIEIWMRPNSLTQNGTIVTTARDPKAPPAPADSELAHGGAADPGGEGIDITLDELTSEWRLMAELYALAVQLDRVRFGSLTFLAAGERIRLKGSYEYEGRKLFEFDDSAQRRSGGSNGCSHEWWHAFDEKKKNAQLRAHAHMKMREMAYFLQQLDRPDCMEANGRSILENSMITISTESGDGRHNDVKRELPGIFHACTGANGRLKTGEILGVGAEGLDVYNTMLDSFDISKRMGPENREFQQVGAIRA